MTFVVMDSEAICDRDLLQSCEGLSVEEWEEEKDRGIPWIYFRLVSLAGVVVKHSPDLSGEFEVRPFLITPEAGPIGSRFFEWWWPKRHRLYTYGGNFFDMPAIEMEAVRDRVDVSGWMEFVGDFKPWEMPRARSNSDRHVDLADFFSNYGGTSKVKLAAVAQRLGYPGKLGVDGSQVQQMWESGRHEDVHGYCACDVMTTLGVAMRVLSNRIDFENPEGAEEHVIETAVSSWSSIPSAVKYVEEWDAARAKIGEGTL